MSQKNHFTQLFCAVAIALSTFAFTTRLSAEEKKQTDAAKTHTVTEKSVIIEDSEVTAARYIIGVSATSRVITKTMRAQIPQLKDKGLAVWNVGNSSPAQKAGIKRHDILLTANEKPLRRVSDLQAVVAQAVKEKKNVTLQFLHEGKTKTVDLKPMLASNVKRTFRPTKITEENTKLSGLMKEMLPKLASGKMTFTSKNENDTEITITKTNDGSPAQIVVTKKGKFAWKGTEKEIEKAPKELQDDLRKAAKTTQVMKLKNLKDAQGKPIDMKSLLTNTPFHTYRNFKKPPRFQVMRHPNHNKELSEMKKQIKELTEAIEKLNQQLEKK